MSDPARKRDLAADVGADATPIAAVHGNLAEHLANERTHLAYVRTAVSLISLGITVNRFSLYLLQRDELPRRPDRLALLGGTASAGLGMVIYALVLMLLALHRYRAVEQAIDSGRYHSDRWLVMVLTLSVAAAAAAGILWMFQR
jgi:putative membrane protein